MGNSKCDPPWWLVAPGVSGIEWEYSTSGKEVQVSGSDRFQEKAVSF